jgi:ArsR family transcriptional regulator
MDLSNDLINLLKLLGDKTRLEILFALKNEKELCVGSIEENLDISQSYLSQQLKKLQEANLLIVRREGRKKYYEIRNKDIFKIIKMLQAYLNNIDLEIMEEKMEKMSKRGIMDTLL